jgi:hypothetical protein
LQRLWGDDKSASTQKSHLGQLKVVFCLGAGSAKSTAGGGSKDNVGIDGEL